MSEPMAVARAVRRALDRAGVEQDREFWQTASAGKPTWTAMADPLIRALDALAAVHSPSGLFLLTEEELIELEKAGEPMPKPATPARSYGANPRVLT